MLLKVYCEKKPAIRFAMGYRAFCKAAQADDPSEEWRRAFFRLMSWQNTWGMADDIGISEWNTDNGREPYVYLVVGSENIIVEQMRAYLQSLGYMDIQEDDIWVYDPTGGIVDGTGKDMFLDNACLWEFDF